MQPLERLPRRGAIDIYYTIRPFKITPGAKVDYTSLEVFGTKFVSSHPRPALCGTSCGAACPKRCAKPMAGRRSLCTMGTFDPPLDIRSPPVLDHISLHSPHCMWREARVEPLFSLFLSPLYTVQPRVHSATSGAAAPERCAKPMAEARTLLHGNLSRNLVSV